jgi:oligopeptide/dipeptide ABC transporter ATP-binding protein
VDGLTFSIQRGETYALVGESGSGKSTVGFSVLRLTEPGIIDGGRILLDGRDLMKLDEKEMCRVRGARVGLVFQEPMSALNPVMRVGTQVGEALRIHRGLSRREVRDEVVRLLRMVSLPDPQRMARAYAHELSGGMAQRVMLAIALACGPELLIADEPTSALDVTIQAEVLSLLRRLKGELGLTVLFITHDFGIVAENADRVGVMYAGRMVEEAPVRDLFADPKHPYTRGLMASQLGAEDAAREGKRPKLATIPGTAAVAASPPPGCRFHPRCAERLEPCDRLEPTESAPGPGRRVWCFLHEPPAGERA